MIFLKAFLVGGAICLIGQLLVDYTKLTPARILVTFVVLGVVLGGLGLYQPLVDWAGAGATGGLGGRWRNRSADRLRQHACAGDKSGHSRRRAFGCFDRTFERGLRRHYRRDSLRPYCFIFSKAQKQIKQNKNKKAQLKRAVLCCCISNYATVVSVTKVSSQQEQET